MGRARIGLFCQKYMSHTCDAVVISCIDWRLHPYVGMFTHNTYGTIDFISLAGAVKGLVDEQQNEDLISNIELSLKLHSPSTIVLTSHRDCGAHGGSAKFENDREQEFSHHARVLGQAEAVIREKFPKLSVVKLFLELDGRNGRWVCIPADLSESGFGFDTAAPSRESAEVA